MPDSKIFSSFGVVSCRSSLRIIVKSASLLPSSSNRIPINVASVVMDRASRSDAATVSSVVGIRLISRAPTYATMRFSCEFRQRPNDGLSRLSERTKRFMSNPVTFPELIFAVAGPIGVDMDTLATVIEEALRSVGYETVEIKLTKEMLRLAPDEVPIKDPDTGKASAYKWKMDYANALRRSFKDPAALARLAVYIIRERRKLQNKELNDLGLLANLDPESLEEAPLIKRAFVIRQIKHPEEVRLLRQIYGKQFVLISAYASESKRHKKLADDIKFSVSTSTLPSDIDHYARKLIERDSSETGEKLGQQLRDAFHLADIFVDGLSLDNMRHGILRFISAFFGKTDITPNKDEYGMYAAKSASLRSGDLSRQVGAAIFTCDGVLVTQGCNEVPKVGGGTYWEGELPDNRDIRKGFDPNDKQKTEILRDVIERLRRSDLLSEALLDHGSDAQIVEWLTRKSENGIDEGVLRESMIMDLTEFGRIVHAEMCALCDAARLGRSVSSCTLFCTTFPCHNCTKHLIAAGILRVVFMEPYPKSRAQELHEDEIELESEGGVQRVSFMPFLGVSPQRYRDIFQKGRRKSPTGAVDKWLGGSPRPMIDVGFPAYTKTSEPWAIAPLIGRVTLGQD